MINWTKQTEDILQNWTDTNKKLWGSLADAAGQQTDQANLADTWRKAVDTWDAAVKNGLEAQLEWSRGIADNVSALPNVPQDLLDWAEQTQKLGVQWNAAQKQLWESYFGMVRKAIPVKMLGTFDGENQKLFSTLQESVESIASAQSTWAQMWTEQAAASASRTAAKSSKKTRATV